MLNTGETTKTIHDEKVVYQARLINPETGMVISQGGPVDASYEQIEEYIELFRVFDAEDGLVRQIVRITKVTTTTEEVI